MITTFVIITFACLLVPLCFYMHNFGSWTLSSNKNDWGAFGDYISGVLNPFLSLLTLAVTTFVAITFNNYQKQQQQDSDKRQERLVRPLVNILVGDYEEQIQVKIKNAGLGPLTIKEVKIYTPNSTTEKNLIDAMPQHPDNIVWHDFAIKIEENVIAAGAEFVLLELTGDSANSTFEDFKKEVRFALKDILIDILYVDIYENEMPKATQLLDIYRRHFTGTRANGMPRKNNNTETVSIISSYLITLLKAYHDPAYLLANKNIEHSWLDKLKEILGENGPAFMEKAVGQPDSDTLRDELIKELEKKKDTEQFKLLANEIMDRIRENRKSELKVTENVINSYAPDSINISNSKVKSLNKSRIKKG